MALPTEGDKIRFRVDAITKELAQIRAELGHRAGSDSEESSLFDDPAGVGSMRAFKEEVDELRRFLWRCINEAAAGAGIDPKSEKHSRRINRATELLQALTTSKAGTQLTSVPEGSFMDSVYRIVDKAGRA